MFTFLTLVFAFLVYTSVRLLVFLIKKALKYLVGKVPRYKLKKIYVKYIRKDINGYLYELGDFIKGVGLGLFLIGFFGIVVPTAGKISIFTMVYTMVLGLVFVVAGARLKIKAS